MHKSTSRNGIFLQSPATCFYVLNIKLLIEALAALNLHELFF